MSETKIAVIGAGEFCAAAAAQLARAGHRVVLDDVVGATIVVIAAGKVPRSDERGWDAYLSFNAATLRKLSLSVAAEASGAKVIVATGPVAPMCHIVQRVTRFSPERVIGLWAPERRYPGPSGPIDALGDLVAALLQGDSGVESMSCIVASTGEHGTHPRIYVDLPTVFTPKGAHPDHRPHALAPHEIAELKARSDWVAAQLPRIGAAPVAL
jgi:malate/lactate dehydrogenase